MFNLYENVRLKKDDLTHGIKSSHDGVIIDILSKGEAYIVEFFDEKGNTIDASLFTQYTPEKLVSIGKE